MRWSVFFLLREFKKKPTEKRQGEPHLSHLTDTIISSILKYILP